MKKSILSALSVLVALPAVAAPTVLLDCNTNFAHDQQVTVYRNDDKLFLVELTRSGARETRPLSPQEWRSGVIALRTSRDGERGTLYRSGNGWMYEVRGYATVTKGTADCD